jgi:hypothetical protein
MEYGAQEQEWMDKILMLEWIQKDWKPAAPHHSISS